MKQSNLTNQNTSGKIIAEIQGDQKAVEKSILRKPDNNYKNFFCY